MILKSFSFYFQIFENKKLVECRRINTYLHQRPTSRRLQTSFVLLKLHLFNVRVELNFCDQRSPPDYYKMLLNPMLWLCNDPSIEKHNFTVIYCFTESLLNIRGYQKLLLWKILWTNKRNGNANSEMTIIHNGLLFSKNKQKHPLSSCPISFKEAICVLLFIPVNTVAAIINFLVYINS